MKKFLLLLALFIPLAGFSQAEFPYSKILYMMPEELSDAKFKLDSEKNRYVLRKGNGWQATSNVLSALNGTTADIRPHEDDYEIVVQYGNGGVSSLTVLFYNDDTYHDLMTFASDRGENLLETNSGDTHKTQFNFDGLMFEMEARRVGVSATKESVFARAKTVDESYNVYMYSVITGIEPDSPWHRKEAAKQQKRDDKGRKKRSVGELM